jgi:curved DNA-binding protein CbpA
LWIQTHPDVNKEPNAAEKFKRVCEAYKVLSNADLRRQYDMMRGGSGGGFAGRSWGRTAGSTSSGAGSAYGAGGSASAEYKRWYDEYASGASQRRTSFDEERAEELDDSFGKILSDFLNTVASKGGRGVVEDVVEFLEDQVRRPA